MAADVQCFGNLDSRDRTQELPKRILCAVKLKVTRVRSLGVVLTSSIGRSFRLSHMNESYLVRLWLGLAPECTNFIFANRPHLENQQLNPLKLVNFALSQPLRIK